MSLIIRARDTIANPAGPPVLPSIGATGVIVRLHARSVLGAVGDPITGVEDASGNGHDATPTGIVKIGSRSGTRTLDLSATAGISTIETATLAGVPKARTIACLAYVGQLPPATVTVVESGGAPNRSRISLLNAGAVTRGAVYGGSTVLSSAPTDLAIGWHVLIGVLRTDGTATLVQDGVSFSGAFTYLDPTAGPFQLYGTTNTDIEFVDAALFDHALSTGEIAAVHAALAAQIPT